MAVMEKMILPEPRMLDKTDLKLLSLLQHDCTLSLQALADAVNLTTTPCWKRLKSLKMMALFAHGWRCWMEIKSDCH